MHTQLPDMGGFEAAQSPAGQRKAQPLKFAESVGAFGIHVPSGHTQVDSVVEEMVLAQCSALESEGKVEHAGP